jgi:prepilin-type N-terminal cleavage/methylation domain-containing protein
MITPRRSQPNFAGLFFIKLKPVDNAVAMLNESPIMNHMIYKKGFTLIELLIVIAIIGVLSSVVLASLNAGRGKSRDATRISSVRQITYALELYFDKFGLYPACLSTAGCTGTALEGSGFMSTIPKDPLTGLAYTYAGIGSGANCTGYHLGVSLEDKSNKAMLTGADAAPRTACTGSAADFSGLSYAAGGQQCNTVAGIPQPSAGATGETCYDQAR